MTVEDVWYTNSAAARAIRSVLVPPALGFGAAVALRNRLYDAGLFHTIPSPIPTISIGNLTVGGTGKTPVAAEVVRRLRRMGQVPAIVMRGYGNDETIVHTLLNPETRVYAGADRVAGIAQAAQDGADVAVLDDAFQHRRAGRSTDIVLISADRWTDTVHLLPSGPFREPLRSLRRASLVLVTHKVASRDTVKRVMELVQSEVPTVPVTSVHFKADGLRPVPGIPMSDSHTADAPLGLDTLDKATVLAIAGVGEPESFFAQLKSAGAIVVPRRFADHHDYNATEVADLARSSASHKYVITTLKDAVKLGPLWPAKGTQLWYVSQAVEVSGTESLIDTTIVNALFPKPL